MTFHESQVCSIIILSLNSRLRISLAHKTLNSQA